jgi:hypothetical protein
MSVRLRLTEACEYQDKSFPPGTEVTVISWEEWKRFTGWVNPFRKDESYAVRFPDGIYRLVSKQSVINLPS